jgi:hypothetical protein
MMAGPGVGKIAKTAVRFGCLLALTVATRAGALIVDTFDEAVTSKLPPGVIQDTVGSTTVTDPGLSGVLGGVRQLTVTATGLVLPNPGPDNVTAGAAVLGDFFDYHCTLGAIGETVLRYDRDGLGLNVSVFGFDHFQLRVIAADASSVPYDATVTVTDAWGGSASSTKTITTSGPTTIMWPLADFSAVDLNAVSSITLVLTPSQAADMRVDLFEVVGPPVLAPLLSPVTMLGLVLLLGMVGLTTIARLR